jgi:hypothetical protein
VDIKQVPLIY